MKNSQVFYEIQTIYQVRKKGKQFQVFAAFNPYYIAPSCQGIFNNRIIPYDEHIGCSGPDTQVSAFCLRNRIFSRLSDTLKYFSLLGIFEYNLEITDHDNHLTKTLLTISAHSVFSLTSDQEKKSNAGILGDVRVDMFRCYRDYFITTFLPQEDEYMDEYPPVYQLDTTAWTLKPVLVFNKATDKKANPVTSSNPSIFSRNEKHRVSDFFRIFDIIKVWDGYRLEKESNFRNLKHLQ